MILELQLWGRLPARLMAPCMPLAVQCHHAWVYHASIMLERARYAVSRVLAVAAGHLRGQAFANSGLEEPDRIRGSGLLWTGTLRLARAGPGSGGWRRVILYLHTKSMR